MINIAHAADIHIGIENYGIIDKDTGFNTRLIDFLKSLDRFVVYASENCDIAVISGDMYKTREPNPTHQRELAKRIKKLSEKIPVVINNGNHDQPNSDTKARAFDLYKILKVPNVYIANKPDIFLINTKNGPLQIACLPYFPKNLLLKFEENRNLSIDEINSKMIEKINNLVSILTNQLDSEIPAILSAHLSVTGAITSSEKNIMIGDEVIIPVSILARPQYKYIALGHIHKYQVIWDKPLTVYSGSIERIDFGEEKDEKGFCHVIIDRDNVSHKFINLHARPFKTIKIEVEGEDPTQKIIDRIKHIELDDSIVRLILKITKDADRKIRYREINKLMIEKCYYFVGINKDIDSDKSALRNPEVTEQLNPIDALEKYFLSIELDVDKSELIKRANILFNELKEEVN
ncbi:exonuclease SbcCD subunit D [Aceticella autotrophica]|uniref:Nuclease SbcCD subunit D n=1 Tax=Aceticella autotrophica TaxID=2755338 RepID=A0A974Y2C0_9THEO|nr:exonuclease SbcCD subunit D [Aceticella autotrophica]QSZ26379.1 exonuclease SbcCD subunit D [Aceticella autotrophica]